MQQFLSISLYLNNHFFYDPGNIFILTYTWNPTRVQILIKNYVIKILKSFFLKTLTTNKKMEVKISLRTQYYTPNMHDNIWHDESISSKTFYPKYAFVLYWITPKIKSVRSFGKQNKLLLLILCKLTKKHFVLPNFCYVLVVYHNIIKLLVNFALWLLSRLLSRPSL